MKKLMFVALLSLTACHPQLNPTNEKLINCADPVVQKAAALLATDVTTALSGDSINWGAQLSAMLAQGEEAVICAVNVFAQSKNTSPITAVPTAAPMVMSAPMQPMTAVRAQAWLQAHNYKIQQPK